MFMIETDKSSAIVMFKACPLVLAIWITVEVADNVKTFLARLTSNINYMIIIIITTSPQDKMHLRQQCLDTKAGSSTHLYLCRYMMNITA